MQIIQDFVSLPELVICVGFGATTRIKTHYIFCVCVTFVVDFFTFLPTMCKAYLHKTCLLEPHNTLYVNRTAFATDPFLSPWLLIPSWRRLRRHQRCCCRGRESHGMDVSILRGRASEASEAPVYPMAIPYSRAQPYSRACLTPAHPFPGITTSLCVATVV